MAICKPVIPVCNNATFCTVGGSLQWDGAAKCLTVSQTPMADGWVTGLLVQNNCIVDYTYATPNCRTVLAPCASTPEDCSGGSGGGNGGTSVSVSPHPDNLTSLSAGALLSRLYSRGEGDVTVTGTGTANNPLVIRVTPQSQNINISAERPIAVQGGSNGAPIIVSWRPTTALTGIYGGITYAAGVATRYDANTENGVIKAIIAGPGIEVTAQTAEVVTVGSKLISTDLVKEHAGIDNLFELDLTGRVINVKPNPMAVAKVPSAVVGEHTIGNRILKFNEYGQLVEIKDVPE